MPKLVTLTIDSKPVTVPAGTLVVDAAKKIGIDIPVFCYHPKMDPVGMCRMCLVDIGRPLIDKATGQPLLEADGSPKMYFTPKLETACTTPVSEGMAVVTQSKKVADARREVVEFILTSHPLDCPVCDKGGECPLQNLTMGFGPGQTRFNFEEKMHLAKHVPLGDLIYLDRERCIQCARCVRFQSDLVDDPVIGFSHRGRSLEIVTYSEPGFDSIFSGNTTDICPVGALTTADFRFGARPWELKPAASICSHCPVGCNLTYNVRREAASGGKLTIKRAMPRQNEAVNEIWICDKGRFAYHFAESGERLTRPLVRKNGALEPVEWDEALEAAAAGLKQAGENLVVLAGGRLPNEDLFTLRKLAEARGGTAALHDTLGGGDQTAAAGFAPGSNLGSLGKGALLFVIASDLHQEAPLWWLRIKAAVHRGATLVVAGARPTRLEKLAARVIRYRYGRELQALQDFLSGPEWAAAQSAAIFYGAEGMDLAASQALAETAAAALAAAGRAGQPNSGLAAVWSTANAQGAWELGLRPLRDAAGRLGSAGALLVAAADPAGDDPALAEAVERAGFVVVQELFLSETARRADVVFPAQASVEREGSFTSGERRVQRFYPVVYAPQGTRADFQIAAALAGKLGIPLEARAPSLVFQQACAETPALAGLSYLKLAETAEQWPVVGRQDLYYGGTTYQNTSGLGVTLPLAPVGSPAATAASEPLFGAAGEGALWLVPVSRLLDRGRLTASSPLLAQRLARPQVSMHPATAQALGLAQGDLLRMHGLGEAPLALDDTLPEGVGLVPRSTGIALSAPRAVRLERAAAQAAAD